MLARTTTLDKDIRRARNHLAWRQSQLSRLLTRYDRAALWVTFEDPSTEPPPQKPPTLDAWLRSWLTREGRAERCVLNILNGPHLRLYPRLIAEAETALNELLATRENRLKRETYFLRREAKEGSRPDGRKG